LVTHHEGEDARPGGYGHVHAVNHSDENGDADGACFECPVEFPKEHKLDQNQ